MEMGDLIVVEKNNIISYSHVPNNVGKRKVSNIYTQQHPFQISMRFNYYSLKYLFTFQNFY